jgi:glycosyltransferase involved in cell wall biosynthesis
MIFGSSRINLHGKVVHPLYDNFGQKIDKAEARKYLDLEPASNIILFFGFIRNYKGLDLLLEAMYVLKQPSNIKPHTSNIKLLIAGEFYEDRKPYDEIIAKYDLASSLILRTNFIADSAVKYYLSAADFVMQPYRKATQSGVTPLAYHFEKPMLVTNVGGLPALVPDGKVGLVAEPNPKVLPKRLNNYTNWGRIFPAGSQRRKEEIQLEYTGGYD